MLSLLIIIVIFLMSLLAPLLAPFERDEIDISAASRWAPFMSVQAETGRTHVLGTDHLGRDVFTRIVYGARVTLTIAVVVSLVSTLIGLAIGAVAGYFRGVIDTALMRFLDFMASIPDFPILLILSSILVTDPKLLPIPDPIVNFFETIMLLRDREARQTTMIMFVLIVFGWTGIARLTRGMVLSLREREFVESSRALGASNVRVILRHVIPNSLAPIIVAFTQGLAAAFATETVLSFLGFGVQDPVPTWGNMMKLAQEFIFQQKTFPLVVGAPILICSLAFNFIGDGLRDALDPRMKL
jgi:peptide/nickel transport system permease protein